MENIMNFLRDEEGLESVDLTLLGVLIALGIIVGVKAFWLD